MEIPIDNQGVFMMSILPKAKEIAFESLFKLLPINFSWVDKDGYILGCNEEMLAKLHINDVIGKHMSEFVSEVVWKNAKEVIDTGTSKIFEEIYHDIKGNASYFLSIKSPIKAKDNTILGVVNISFDITDRKLMEIELDKATKAAKTADKAKTVFLRNMSHDLRTPFAGIIGSAELLELKETDDNKKQYLKNIRDCATSLLNHFNEIIEYAKLESGEFPLSQKEFDLYLLIENIHQMMFPLANTKQIDFNVTTNAWPPRFLIGDSVRTQRILTNMIANAIKFTHQGAVDVWIDWHPFLNDQTKGVLRVNIEDTGVGIPKDKQDLIFERFQRLSPSYDGIYQGAGLGLPIAKQFLEEMKGEISMYSEVGIGTKFSLRIPYEISPKNE